jgi:hypothetical protein
VKSTPHVADDLYRARIQRARQMAPSEKLSAGFELFEFACGISRAGIRHQFPSVNEAQVESILKQRLALHRRLEIGQWKSKK